MGFLKSLLNRYVGYRWSLYLSQARQVYCLAHSQSVLALLPLVRLPFLRRGEPMPPWELHLNHNPTNRVFELHRNLFVSTQIGYSDEFLRELGEVDSRLWESRGTADVVAVDAATGKVIPAFQPLTADAFLAPPPSPGGPFRSFSEAVRVAFPTTEAK